MIYFNDGKYPRGWGWWSPSKRLAQGRKKTEPSVLKRFLFVCFVLTRNPLKTIQDPSHISGSGSSISTVANRVCYKGYRSKYNISNETHNTNQYPPSTYFEWRSVFIYIVYAFTVFNLKISIPLLILWQNLQAKKYNVPSVQYLA